MSLGGSIWRCERGGWIYVEDNGCDTGCYPEVQCAEDADCEDDGFGCIDGFCAL